MVMLVATYVVAQTQVNYGVKVVILATPKSGGHFVKWSDGNTENPRVITVLDNVNLVAEFDYNDYTLTTQVNSEERGSVTAGENIQYTQTKELIATPNYGYAFKNWTVSGSGSKVSSTSSNPTTFTMGTENATVTANFIPLQYRISLFSSNTTMGSVSGGDDYDYNTSLTISAIPNPGYRFVSWRDGNIENPRTIIVSGSEDFVANFDYNDYILTTQVNSEKKGSVTSGESIQYTQTKELTAIPKDGYIFRNWVIRGDGASLSSTTSNPTIFTMGTSDATVIAIFKDNPSDGNGGEGTAVSENTHTVLVYGLDMHVIVQGAATQTISVYNVAGQLLETRVAVSDKEVFDVYPEGVYIVNVGESTYKVVVK